jgi:S-(hydroxymethyl)glutathione dehydrogenase / alcohol dehydrogenase
MKAKAAIYHGPKQPLSVENIDVDAPSAHEVLVRNAACGVCHSDLHFASGAYPISAPSILGHESAGVVEAVGEGVSELHPGDHVVAFNIAACGICELCMAGHPVLCTNQHMTHRPPGAAPRYSWQGRDVTGQIIHLGRPRQFPVGFAEYLLLHERCAVRIPPAVPLDRAALIGCGVMTGVGAVVNSAKVTPGASVAIFGAGGVGIAVIQGARLAGARQIIAVDIFDPKLQTARRFGATDIVHAGNGDAVEEIRRLTAGAGVDFSFEAIGTKKTIEQSFECLALGGTAAVIGGVPAGIRMELDPNFLKGERRLIGVTMGSSRYQLDIPRYADLYLRGRLNLDDMVSRRIGLDGIDDAFKAMQGGELVRAVVAFG